MPFRFIAISALSGILRFSRPRPRISANFGSSIDRNLGVMPRRPRASNPALETAASITTAVDTSPGASSGPTLVHALDHIPPKNAPLSDDELTPPPPVEVAVDAAVEQVLDQSNKRRRISKKAAEEIAEAVGESPAKQRAPRRAAQKVKQGASAGVREESEEVEEHEEPQRKPKRTPKKAKVEDEAFEDDEPMTTTPSKKKTPKKKTAPTDGDEGNGEGSVKKKTPKKSRIAKDEPEYDSEGNEIVKKKRKSKVYPKIEYDIPPVETKETTFRGRLGYACLNTVLRKTKPDSIFCSRTCRIASIEEEGMELPKGLALMNLRDLKTMVQWNEDNKIRFMRLSSEMFPFASHEKYGYDLSFAATELKEIGDLAKSYGHRLTMHPGQFTQIGSPKEKVVEASVRELNYQCEIMDRMGLDQDGVMIIHMGGIYDDKPGTLERFKHNYTTKLSDTVKRRLVLENDELCYNVDDLLPLCNELEIPIIFDYHHDWIYPSSKPPSELIPLIAETWKKKGIRMKQHLSEPRPGAETVMEKRAHADRCKALPPDLPDDVDLMIEAKDKEQAVFELYRIYGLEDVVWDNLRPPDPEPGLRTNGRKSSVKKKQKDTGATDEDGNPIMLEEFEKEGDGDVGDEGLVEPRIDEPTEEIKAEVRETKTPTKRGRKRASGTTANVETEIKVEVVPSASAEETVEVQIAPEVEETLINGADHELDKPLEEPKKKRGRAKKAIAV